MKTLKTISKSLMVVAVVAFAMCLTSCKKKPAEDIAGTYTGSVKQTVASSDTTYTGLSVTLTATSDDVVTIEWPSIGVGRMAASALSIPNVKVTKESKGSYTLEEADVDVTTEKGTNYKGKVKGSVKDDVLSIDLTVTPGAMPMSINYLFESTK